ncbi:MAG: DsbC family protein [Methylococcales bacterium]|nr:DsbC family protein [Methylococcales bacterium]
MQLWGVRFLKIVLAVVCITPVYAGEEAVRAALAKAMPSLTVDSIQGSEIPGVYEVVIGSKIVYVSSDGNYLLQGQLIDIAARKDLTEGRLSGARVKAVAGIAPEEMLIFTADAPQYKITVFTDIDCGYCRKLHREIDQYLARGISVHYLFYPRAGLGSESYDKAVSVWCANDRHAALTAAKSGQDPIKKTCDNPVKKHMALANTLGLSGTPMMVTEKGTIFAGYMPAEQLEKALAFE